MQFVLEIYTNKILLHLPMWFKCLNLYVCQPLEMILSKASANRQNREKRRPTVLECSIFSSLFSRIIFQSFGKNGSTLTTD